ncbi:hypothetical protein [Aromatoleum aromaticum]|nr:hypothetical protein [Aromatoleum aromaticum]NMG54250.1 hypothetical protein [Aromatoleum aromaticum]
MSPSVVLRALVAAGTPPVRRRYAAGTPPGPLAGTFELQEGAAAFIPAAQ